ncbi:glycosyltransferase [Lactococcus lactis]|uniref:dTDP-rhamnosyl transferase RfbF n=1 Tax=Lactococcus lactis subsp. lactis TaxID=1360 RepID=A0A2N5WDD8_LACLL|nr:glycosyltransferase [Lactococcus lactis]MBU5241949.1 glycosyltransferase [Lactococcus lactis]MDT2856110.1 glycosyltransferase [Lactococcus lactis]PLW60256.1 dTDP-rhamnosyl transferase RfbF [Lactococcus lactis subsp. lactis]
MKQGKKFLAGIVTFNPEFERLKENILGIISQVHQVILVDNGSDNICDIISFVNSFAPSVKIIELGENLGIATALNKIGDFAVEHEFCYFLALDQDSVSLPGVIEEFKKYLYLPKIGLLNSYHKDRNLQSNSPQNTVVIEDPQMITSGSLMPTYLFEQGFKYDERLFIDKVDFDLDILLMNAGYHLYQIPFYGLLHEVGEIKSQKFLFYKTKTYNHSPFRRYYMSRNTVLMFKKYGLTKRTLMFFIADVGKAGKTLLYESKKADKLKKVIQGYIDGIKYKV